MHLVHVSLRCCNNRNVRSADKALAILAAFSEARPELGVSELAAELGLHKSTVSRLLATLQARGLVAREGDRFLPGPELARLGSLAIRGFALVKVAREPLARLEYASVADRETLRELDRVDRPALASLAVRFPSTRLIDCLPLG